MKKVDNQEERMETFGEIISSERRLRRLGLKNIAEQIMKADGRHISVQYLDNLEKDLRTPSQELIPQFAQVLQLPADLLYCALGRFPLDLLEYVETRDQLISALEVFRQTIISHEKGKQNDRRRMHYEYVSTPPHPIEPNSIFRNPRLRSSDELKRSVPINDRSEDQ
jgi:transcriptional regulator with XRE-family HTH domain